MKRAPGLFALALLVLSLAACTAHGNMYNLATGEKTTFSYSYNGGGRGKMTGTFASGETATGEYSVITGGSVGWGAVYASVYGPSGPAYGSANAVSVRRNARREGSAILRRLEWNGRHLRVRTRPLWPRIRSLQEQRRRVVQVALLNVAPV